MDLKKWDGFFIHQSELLFNKRYPLLDSLLKASPHYLDYGDVFCAVEDEHVRDVEKAIRKFAKTGKWPKMSNAVGRLVIERLLAAEETIEHLEYFIKAIKIGPPSRRMSDEKIILWFMIELWDELLFENFVNSLRAAPYPFTPIVKQTKATLPFFGRN